MTEPKKSKNPFVNMANEAKKNNANKMYGKATQAKTAKPSKGFGGANVVRRSGRGG